MEPVQRNTYFRHIQKYVWKAFWGIPKRWDFISQPPIQCGVQHPTFNVNTPQPQYVKTTLVNVYQLCCKGSITTLLSIWVNLSSSKLIKLNRS